MIEFALHLKKKEKFIGESNIWVNNLIARIGFLFVGSIYLL